MGRAWSASFPRTSCLHEVPEVAQETFVRAYRSLRSYQGQGSFERWLSTIALRCCYERLRERYRPEAPFSSLAEAKRTNRKA